MKPLQEYPGASYHDFLDFLIVDQTGEQVGTLYSAWSDQHTGAFEFLGIKTNLLTTKNHIVPARDALVDEEKQTIQVPYTLEFLKAAPVCDAAAEVTEEHEKAIREYYRSSR